MFQSFSVNFSNVPNIPMYSLAPLPLSIRFLHEVLIASLEPNEIGIRIMTIIIIIIIGSGPEQCNELYGLYLRLITLLLQCLCDEDSR